MRFSAKDAPSPARGGLGRGPARRLILSRRNPHPTSPLQGEEKVVAKEAPSPAREGPGRGHHASGRARPLPHPIPNRLDDAVLILEQLIVPEAHDLPPLGGKERVTPAISRESFRRAMLATVDLDDELDRWRSEIDDIGADRMLLAERHAKLGAAKPQPEPNLIARQSPPQAASAARRCRIVGEARHGSSFVARPDGCKSGRVRLPCALPCWGRTGEGSSAALYSKAP